MSKRGTREANGLLRITVINKAKAGIWRRLVYMCVRMEWSPLRGFIVCTNIRIPRAKLTAYANVTL